MPYMGTGTYRTCTVLVYNGVTCTVYTGMQILWSRTVQVELLPRAELLVIEEGTHTAPIDQTIEVNRRVRQFLRRPRIRGGALQSEGGEERIGSRRKE